MIATKAKESIDQAVCYELQNIVKEYGPTYHSTHEGYAILKEEVEEAADDLHELEWMLEVLWQNIRINYKVDDDLTKLKGVAVALAGEAVQCAAVLEKFLSSVEEIKHGKKE